MTYDSFCRSREPSLLRLAEFIFRKSFVNNNLDAIFGVEIPGPTVVMSEESLFEPARIPPF